LKLISKDVDELKVLGDKQKEKLDKKVEKGKPVTEAETQEVEVRQEIVDLCYKHIDECKHLERQGKGGNAFFDDDKKGVDATITELPDIDDEEFIMLKRTDAQIDQQLDKVAQGVGVLREIATEIGKELELQDVMINELGKKVDDTQAQLNQINIRMKKTLQKVRKGDRFIIDFILVVVVLGIVFYIYQLSKK